MNYKYVRVISTFSNDKLINAKGKVFTEQRGGPALFIEQVLRAEDIPYKLVTGLPIDVEILVTNKDELGKIPKIPKRQVITDLDSSDWVIVSTILDEWLLGETLPSKLFIDLQGYVRNGNDYGKKRVNQSINKIAGKVFCIKGTKEEASYLSRSALEAQKQRLLIVTNSGNDIELWNKGVLSVIKVRRLKDLPETIGAGDTFLGYFVASMFQSYPPIRAAQTAIDKTAVFLKSKVSERYVL